MDISNKCFWNKSTILFRGVPLPFPSIVKNNTILRLEVTNGWKADDSAVQWSRMLCFAWFTHYLFIIRPAKQCQQDEDFFMVFHIFLPHFLRTLWVHFTNRMVIEKCRLWTIARLPLSKAPVHACCLLFQDFIGPTGIWLLSRTADFMPSCCHRHCCHSAFRELVSFLFFFARMELNIFFSKLRHTVTNVWNDSRLS